MFNRLPPATGAPYGLRAEGRQSPALGISTAIPRLAWRLPSDVGDTYDLILEAAASEDDLRRRANLLWAVHLPPGEFAAIWGGTPLEPRAEVHWRVGLETGRTTLWSASAVLDLALADSDWKASWVTSPDWANPDPNHNGPPPVLGKDITFDSKPKRARLYVASAGVLDLRLNGRPASDAVLLPGYCVSAVRVPAVALDVTDTLAEGLNALRVTVAAGIAWVPAPGDRYTKQTTAALPPRLLLRLEVELQDGSTQVVATDESWFATTGPVRMSHWYGGEDVDGRVGHTDEPIAGNRSWGKVAVVGASDAHALWWTARPQLKVVATRVANVIASGDSRLLVDVGENIAGWPVLHLRGVEAGRRIEVWPAELLDEVGRIDQRTSGAPLWDSYTTCQGDQTWHPQHVYHGFRYLEIRGASADELEVEAWVIRADDEPVGQLSLADDFLTALHRIIDRAVQSNMYSVFTDCPNREKLGWVEQLHLCFGLLTRLYDVEAHLRDSLALMRDAQRPSGLIPSTVPETFDFTGAEWNGDATAFIDDVNWGGAIALLALLHYREYGDRRVLSENWPAIQHYRAHLERRGGESGILDFGLGDWIALDESTPRSLVATYGYLRFLRAAARIGRELGEGPAAVSLENGAELTAAAFSEQFGDGDTWGSGSQASYALALDLGVVPGDTEPQVFAALLQAIADAQGHLSVGENAWPALVRVLHQHGRDDLVAALVRDDEGPGYGLQLKLGATSLTETWRGASGAMYENSQNHFMLGMIHDWIASNVVGLAQRDDSLAWATADIRPTPIAGLISGSTSYATTRGRYQVEWTTHPRPSCRIEIPLGGRATVQLPTPWTCGGQRSQTLDSGRWEWLA